MKAQTRKSKFRKTSKWKDFRKKMKAEQKVCQLTGRPLLKGFNLHHLDLREENYEIIRDKNRFVCLNKKSHEFIHFMYTYYKKDKDIIKRLVQILDRMVEVNSPGLPDEIKEDERV